MRICKLGPRQRPPVYSNRVARLHTVGHSTRRSEELLALLAEHQVSLLVDVRRHPGSRRFPHFAREALAATLAPACVGYRHEPALGGRRSPRPDSPHTAWRVAAFRGYADYMDTAPFEQALNELLRLAEGATVAVLCAEALPWKCHRWLIADALVARGSEVVHILGYGKSTPHALSAHARLLADGRLLYDRAPAPLFEPSI